MSEMYPAASTVLRRRLTWTSLAVGSVIMLAACSPAGDVEESPAPTPSESTLAPDLTDAPDAAGDGAPDSAEGAIDAATEAFVEYNDLENLINREQGADTARIDAVALGQAREAIVSKDWTTPSSYEGGITVSVQSSYALDLTADGATVPFGSVGLLFCNDESTRTITRPDGSIRQSQPSVIMEAAVQYVPSSDNWKVASIVIEGDPC